MKYIKSYDELNESRWSVAYKSKDGKVHHIQVIANNLLNAFNEAKLKAHDYMKGLVAKHIAHA